MQIHWYGLVVGVGVMIAMTVAERVSSGRVPVWEAFWYMLVPGLVGTRVYHVADQWVYYQDNLGEIIKLWQGGMGIWGGVIGAILGLWLYGYLRAKKLETKITEEVFMAADIFGLVAPLAQALGRWGNLANDELWGVNGEPLFVYESGLNLMLFGLLLALYRRQLRGGTFGSYLLGYGVIRIALEPMRVESWQWGSWGAAEWLGLTAATVGIMILARKGRKVWQ
jgi:phosphatidylglycerol:prolipoprotein diacylglycerol transferase